MSRQLADKGDIALRARACFRKVPSRTQYAHFPMKDRLGHSTL